MGDGIPLILLHQTPWFSVQYATVQPLLAAAGIQSIAMDTPGFGFSDLPSEQPTIEGYADNLPYVLDALRIDRTAVAGFHTGASIAAAFAHRHKDRTTCLTMDGAPMYTVEEGQKRLSQPH
jgi:pimeloyl-ACP methyl ester carboxylesterase